MMVERGGGVGPRIRDSPTIQDSGKRERAVSDKKKA